MVQPKSNRLLVESQIGAPNGVAGLGLDAKIPDAQLPPIMRKGTTVISVADYFPDGYTPKVTDAKGAFDAAVAAAPEGATVQFPPGADVYMTYGEPIRKTLTIDCNMSDFTVDPTPGSGTAGKPVIYFAGTLSAFPHDLTATAVGSSTVTFATTAQAANYAPGDTVILSDSTQVLPWDNGIAGAAPIYPNGYTGLEEITIVQSVNTATGVLTLTKPTEYAYSVSPKITKVSKVLNGPRVINARSITEVDPGGLNTSSLVGPNAPHLVHFQYANTPRVENMHFDKWNVHAVNFHRCINPLLLASSGRDPFRPTDGGHGYLARIQQSYKGGVHYCSTKAVRHHADYVMTVDPSQSHNVAVAPISCAYFWHGFGSKRGLSESDSVLDAGVAWGWAVGNGAFNADYDITISNPRYVGNGIGINVQAKAQNVRIINPDLHSSSRNIIVTTGAGNVDIFDGSIETVGNSATANSLLIRDKAAIGDAYGLRPGSVRMHGTRLRGANPAIYVDSAGAVEFLGVTVDEVNAAINIITVVSVPAHLRIAHCAFAGSFTSAVNIGVAAPAGDYSIESNHIRGNTGRAMTLPAATNLRFTNNTSPNNGSGLNPWNMSGDRAAAVLGAGDYAAVIFGNSPRTLDEARGSAVSVAGAAGTARALSFLTGDLLRWILRATSAAESGSDAGSDFEIVGRTDAGGAGPQLMLLKRNGDSIFGAFGKKIGFLGTTPVSKPSITGSRAGESAASASTRAALVAVGLATDNTTA